MRATFEATNGKTAFTTEHIGRRWLICEEYASATIALTGPPVAPDAIQKGHVSAPLPPLPGGVDAGQAVLKTLFELLLGEIDGAPARAREHLVKSAYRRLGTAYQAVCLEACEARRRRGLLALPDGASDDGGDDDNVDAADSDAVVVDNEMAVVAAVERALHGGFGGGGGGATGASDSGARADAVDSELGAGVAGGGVGGGDAGGGGIDSEEFGGFDDICEPGHATDDAAASMGTVLPLARYKAAVQPQEVMGIAARVGGGSTSAIAKHVGVNSTSGCAEAVRKRYGLPGKKRKTRSMFLAAPLMGPNCPMCVLCVVQRQLTFVWLPIPRVAHSRSLCCSLRLGWLRDELSPVSDDKAGGCKDADNVVHICVESYPRHKRARGADEPTAGKAATGASVHLSRSGRRVVPRRDVD